ncbi:hypothetical protein DUNSADRAFT_11581 [Dunaliella salina]|uniref:Uncharacterized protein n=1 Tax=Dunaliella salina TaxID=3046 RepID=A0ABQ7GD36_DUNSA|nr:hypothetical protein DUNSADRAFT_11581 [Dunaliella salina]|eukprot:KAF5832509.1 hypothetical protein DUNSADRAFT_11581 [Dunaliella salina]
MSAPRHQDVSMRALSSALGARKAPGQAQILAEGPLPELPSAAHPDSPPPSSVKQHTSHPSSAPASHLSSHSPAPDSVGQAPSSLLSQSGAAAVGGAAGTPDGSSLASSQTQPPKPAISPAARAAALRPPLVKGRRTKHAAPGAPPPRKYAPDRQASTSRLHASEGATPGAGRKPLAGQGSMMYLDDATGEVQRGADGSRLSILQVIDNDGGNPEVLNPELLKAQREKFLLEHRAVNAESVPELHKRLIQRREVMATLAHWTNGVLRKSGKGFRDDEILDAEQLEEEKKAPKTGGVGVGASLRAYWNATVQDEVELRFNTMRVAWEKETAADMAELKDLRDKSRKFKSELEDAKQKLAGLTIKYEVAQKQVISAQRAIPNKQASSAADPAQEPQKPSAGEQAVVEAMLIQLKTDLGNVKGQLEMANARAELYERQVSKSKTDLESAQGENSSLLTKLQEAEAAPGLAPTPSKGGGDGRGESAKLKKDLDKIQNEHAKLQVSLKAKTSEVEKLAKELKEARMKPPPRAAQNAAAPAASTPDKSPARGALPAQSSRCTEEGISVGNLARARAQRASKRAAEMGAPLKAGPLATGHRMRAKRAKTVAGAPL